MLIHLRIDHEIEDIPQFMEALKEVGEEKERREQFAKYVMELQEKKAKGLITAEDYRNLTMQWSKEHE